MKVRSLALKSTALTYVASALAILPSPAYAQVAQDVPAASPTEVTPQGRSIGSAQIEDIVVTAARRAESAQKSSLALQVLDGEELQRQGVTQLKDLTALVPAFNVGSRGSFTQIYVRGVGAFVTTPLDESPVAVNLDQVYLSSPAGIGGMLFDLERLEVLKGPQGTLYGRNASGGALNVVTRKPDLNDPSGYVSGEYGNYDLKQVEGALNLPFGETFALRGAFQIVDRDGYYEDNSGDDVHQSGRLHALWRPNEMISLLVTGDYTHVGGDGEGYAIFPRIDRDDPYTGLLDPRVDAALAGVNPTLRPLSRPSQDNSTYGIQADLQFDLGGVMVNVIPAWRRTELDFVTSGSGSVYTVKSTEPQKTLEVRLSSDEPGSAIKWVVGGYYFHVKKDALYVSDFDPRNQLTIESGELKNESYAGFADATLEVANGFRVLGGIRYTHETKDQTGFTDTTSRGVQTITPSEGHLSFNKFSWRAGLEYDLAPSAMVFLTAANGFKSGGIVLTPGPDGTPNRPFANTYGPEVLNAYTLGLKSRLFGDRLQFNVEAFYWDYKDQQITQNGPVNPVGTLGRVVVNVPQAPTLYGLDTSIAWKASPVDLFTADVAYLKAKYDELVLVGSSRSSAATTGCVIKPATDPRLRLLDCSGFPLIRSPRWSGTVGYQHIFDLQESGEIVAAVRTQFSSRYFTGIDYLPSQVQDSFTNTSADVTYEAPNGAWSVTAYVRNLEDKAVVTASRTHAFAPGVSFDVLNPPRTYGVRARFNF